MSISDKSTDIPSMVSRTTTVSLANLLKIPLLENFAMWIRIVSTRMFPQPYVRNMEIIVVHDH